MIAEPGTTGPRHVDGHFRARTRLAAATMLRCNKKSMSSIRNPTQLTACHSQSYHYLGAEANRWGMPKSSEPRKRADILWRIHADLGRDIQTQALVARKRTTSAWVGTARAPGRVTFIPATALAYVKASPIPTPRSLAAMKPASKTSHAPVVSTTFTLKAGGDRRPSGQNAVTPFDPLSED